tara:strand:- start:605 stop:829 length:225 start_codon:yes stop_codon:yes gene_type:complete
MPEKTLLSETIRLLRDRPHSLSLETIAQEINVSTGWLSNLLSAKDSGGARVDAVERLYALLSDTPLFPADSTGI